MWLKETKGTTQSYMQGSSSRNVLQDVTGQIGTNLSMHGHTQTLAGQWLVTLSMLSSVVLLDLTACLDNKWPCRTLPVSHCACMPATDHLPLLCLCALSIHSDTMNSVTLSPSVCQTYRLMLQQQQQASSSSRSSKVRGTNSSASPQPFAPTAAHLWTPCAQQQHVPAAAISRQMTHCY
jgi:hypothetical protein